MTKNAISVPDHHQPAAVVRMPAANAAHCPDSESVRVFLATAVSQSGRLDGLLVFAAQSRMVWKIALLHYQRPSVRDMINLYANVAGTAFVASEIEDININEHVEPVIGAARRPMAAAGERNISAVTKVPKICEMSRK